MSLFYFDSRDEGLRAAVRGIKGLARLGNPGRQHGESTRWQTRRSVAPRMLRVALASMLCVGTWAQAQTTECTGTLYVSNATGNTVATVLNKIDISTNPPKLDKLGDTGGANHNGLGYNPADKYFYAMKYEENTLLRVRSNGTVEDLGAVNGLPKGKLKAFTAGTFDEHGKYYVKVQGTTNIIYVVDVNTKSHTGINLTQGIQISDMAFVNGVLYSVGDNGQLYKIDINGTTGTVELIGDPYSTPTGTQLGAQFGAPNGLFGTANDGSGFFFIDVITGKRTKLADSPKANSNDGANCPSVALNFPADLAITKTAQSKYVAGSPLEYTIEVTNEGEFDVTDAHVTDPLPAGITDANWTCTAAGGATCGNPTGTGAIDEKVHLPKAGTVTYTLTMDIPADFTNEITNTASVALPAGASYLSDPNPANNQASASSGQRSADLSITNTDGALTYKPGTDVTYTITVTNAGPDDVTGATVSDTLPAGITSASWTCAAEGGATCNSSGSGVLNEVITLPAGGKAVYRVTVSVPDTFTGELENTATVTAPAGVVDSNLSNNTATDVNGTGAAKLSITKTDGASTYQPGTDVTYTITVTNDGPDEALGAIVRDPLPAGISAALWSCEPSAGAYCAPSGDGALEDTVNLPMGGTATYTFVMTVPDTFSGALVNTASVTPPPGMASTDAGSLTATDVNQQQKQADETDGSVTPVPLGGGWALLLLTGLMGAVTAGVRARKRG